MLTLRVIAFSVIKYYYIQLLIKVLSFPVEEDKVRESKPLSLQESVTRTLPHNDHTQHIDDITPQTNDTTPQRRPTISDSVFTTSTADIS